MQEPTRHESDSRRHGTGTSGDSEPGSSAARPALRKGRRPLPPRTRILRLVGGVTLVVLGILGLLLPVMPGWIFLIPGIALLSSVTPRVRKLLRAIRNRVPRRLAVVRAFFHRLQALARRRRS